MVKLTGILSRLGSIKVLVIGDLLLDSYTIGKARRISPEAPVAVLQVQHEEHRPGGAGNVMLNLISMGAQVVAMGRVGYDKTGEILIKNLEIENIITSGIVYQKDFPTPVKNRIIADNQQIVRVDHEKVMPIPQYLEDEVITSLPELLNGVQVVAISDYGKGFLSKTMIRAIIDQANVKGIPIIADPKGINFAKYCGSTVIKPNLTEAYAAANLPLESSLEEVAEKILLLTQAEALMLTRSESGISLFLKDGTHQTFPVRVREVKDVTGAGDTVLAMLTCALANGLSYTEAAQLSNVAAGIAIERFGCARITLSDLARRLLNTDVVNKVFDEEHLFALQHVLDGYHFCLLAISGSEGLTSSIFTNIRKLTQNQEKKLIVHVYDEEVDEEFISILASLRDVDFIIVNHTSLRNLCQKIVPDEVYYIKNDQLENLESFDNLLAVTQLTPHLCP
jgi:rfaE bifunctional protein kinase chain/domain